MKPASADALQATMLQPGLIWGCARTADGTTLIEDCEEHADSGFRWLHLNLADQRSHGWIARSANLPVAIRELMSSHDSHQRAVIQNGFVALVLHDFEREFDSDKTSRVGAIHMALGPSLMLTGRYHPVYSADIIRKRIAKGAAVTDAASALEHLLGGITDAIASAAHDVTADLVAAEDEFLAEQEAPDTRDLVGVRRRAAQVHRMISGMRTALHRLETDPGLPSALAPLTARFYQRLHALDADIVAAQNQLKLLRDELDLQAAQRTNQNIYFLSIMSALMLPATLVTGFFGMNTGGLPLVETGGGTLLATFAAIAASAGTYFILRLVGLVRR